MKSKKLPFSKFQLTSKTLQSILIEENKSIIIFDGECNLCDFVINFLKKRNKNERIFFLSFQTIVHIYFVYFTFFKMS